MSRVRPAFVLVVLLLLLPPAASAQLGRQLETAGVSWTPTIALREVGTDSNVFLVQGGSPDKTAILSPSVRASATGRLVGVQGEGNLDFVYFEKYRDQRSINRKVTGRVQFDLSRITPFITGSLDAGRERQSDIDLRIPRRGHVYGGGFALPLTAKGSVEVSLTKGRQEFDGGQTFRGIELAQSLNRRSEIVNVGFRYSLTALTNFSLDASRVRDFYDADKGRNTQDLRVAASLFFSPDAIVKGRLTIGYHKLRVVPPLVPFSGLLADANVGYTFRESSRFNLRYFRDTTASYDSPYNVNTQYGVDLVQDIAGPLKATAAVSRSQMNHSTNLFINQIARLERYDSYAVGLAFYWSTSVRSTLAYDFQRRRSSLQTENFDRRRLLASVSLVL